MLNEININEEVFKVDVNKDFQFVPVKVRVIGKERGMIRYKHPNGAEWLWIGRQFFHNETDCLEECKMLEREASGEVTPRMQEERKIWKKHLNNGGLVRILPLPFLE